MRCQAQLNFENETCFRSGGGRNADQLFDYLYHLVAWCQFIFVIL